MSLKGLIETKFANFTQRYAKELQKIEAAPLEKPDFKPVSQWGVQELVTYALTIQPYWTFIEEQQFEALVEMLALIDHPIACELLTQYESLSEGRREQLHKYLTFFLHSIVELIKNGSS